MNPVIATWSGMDKPCDAEAPVYFYCSLTALLRKPLIINGAGEGNRTHPHRFAGFL